MLAIAGAVIAFALVRRFDLLGHLVRSAEVARALGLMGALVGGGVIVASTPLLLPINPLIALAGFVWGWWGLLVVIPSAVASATVACLLARAFGRSAAAQALRGHPQMERVVAIAERGGVLTVALLRVSLVVPFTPGNVILGLTQMPAWQVAVGTGLGIILPATAFVYVGTLFPDAAAILRGDIWPPARALALGAAGLVLMFGVGALVARKLHRDHPVKPAPASEPAEQPPR